MALSYVSLSNLLVILDEGVIHFQVIILSQFIALVISFVAGLASLVDDLESYNNRACLY